MNNQRNRIGHNTIWIQELHYGLENIWIWIQALRFDRRIPRTRPTGSIVDEEETASDLNILSLYTN